MTFDFTSINKDNVARVKDKLDQYDQTYNRDNGESILQLTDCLGSTAQFDTLDKLMQAYKLLIHGPHKGFITKVKPEMDTKMLRITINMGLEDKTKARGFLPLIGQVQLRYGYSATRGTIDRIF